MAKKSDNPWWARKRKKPSLTLEQLLEGQVWEWHDNDSDGNVKLDEEDETELYQGYRQLGGELFLDHDDENGFTANFTCRGKTLAEVAEAIKAKYGLAPIDDHQEQEEAWYAELHGEDEEGESL